MTPWARLHRLPFVAWIILYCAWLWGIFGALLGAVAPNLHAQMGLGFAQIGWLMAIWSSGGGLGSFLGGALAKRWAPQRLLASYASAVLLALIGVLLAPGFATLAVALVCIAVCETALFTLGHGLLAEISDDPDERTRVIGLADVGFSSGSLVSPLLVSAALGLNPSWRAPYAAFGVFALLLWGLTWQRQRLRGVGFRPIQPSTAAAATGYRQLLRQPLVQAVCVAGICSGFVEWGQYFWFVSYASNGLGLSPAAARWALDGLMGGMMVGRLWQSFWPSRLSMAQKLQGLSVLALLALVALACLPAGSSALGLAVLNGLAGLGVSVGFPILLGSALRGFAAEAPRLSALLMVAFTLGSQSAALGLGVLASHAGLRATYFALALGALGLSLGVRRLNRLLAQPAAPGAAASM